MSRFKYIFSISYGLRIFGDSLVGLFVILLLLVGSQDAIGFQFKDQLQNRTDLNFKHWNTKKKEITGFTQVSFERLPEKDILLEHSRNMDEDRKVYSEKTLRFSLSSGELIRYEETDFRTDLKTVNSYSKSRIETQIWDKKSKKDFNVEITKDLVPFEILSYFLQSELDDIKRKDSIRFTVYLPVLAFKFSKSLSQLEMKATIENSEERDTPLGKKPTLTIRVEPTSFIVKALLPSDKSKFDFTFIDQKPYLLLMFEEGDTQTILEAVN